MALVTKNFSDIITFTRASTATFFNSAGVLTSAAINAPRFDYNPSTLVAQGLLIEESRTNSIRNNTMVGAVAGSPGTVPTNWAVTSTGGVFTRTIVGTGTENGVTYFEVRFQASGAGTAAVQFDQGNVIAATVGQNWSSTSYVKLVGGSYTNITDTRIIVVENDSGGSFLSAGITSFTATGSALSTQRVTHSRTLASATTAFVVSAIQILFSGAGDITLRIGLPQLEQGAFATSVIPTTTTALTRAADVASVNTLSPWYNSVEGALYAEFAVNGYSSAAFPFIAQLGVTGIGNRGQAIVLNGPSNNTAFNIFDDTATYQGVPGSGPSTLNTTIKIAGSYKTNDSAASFNGSSPTTDTSVILATGINRLGLGQSALLGGHLNGYLRRITYYPRRLSNAELQALTV
jgi:hypothetical protein